MATFYIQLENKLLQISGELTTENISKALGYVPVSPKVTNELSQRVDNITFDSLKDNPFLQDGSGELNIVDEAGNIIAKIDVDGIHSVDFIVGEHRLSDKADKSELSNYATKDEVSDLVDMSVVTELQGKVNTLIDADTDKSVRDIAVDVLTETLVSETATEAYDTLAEMSAWIKSHPEDAAAMNTTIQKNATDIQSNTAAITNLDAAYKTADAKVLTDAQEYTNNINFYTIKDNPIVDGEAGSITFVDETGYIGLKVTEDGIIAKDVVTPEHTLSSKADKSFVEDNYYNKSTVDKKITEAVTGGQVSLDGFATEQWVNEQGFLKEHQDISHLADKSELPTKTSDLTNDSGFITINDVPEVTVPTKVSELENDKGFITISDVPEIEIPSVDGFVKSEDLPNFDEFAKTEDIPSLDDYASKEWVNNKNYATEYDLKTIDYSSINNVPVSEDETGELNIADESGNIGMKVASEAVYAKDFVSSSGALNDALNRIAQLEETITDLLNRIQTLEEFKLLTK